MHNIHIDHVGIAVNNLKTFEDFFKKYFGILHSVVTKYEELGLFSQMIEFDNLNLELLEAINKTGTIHRFIEKRGEGYHHISLRVKNLDQLIKDLSQKGYEPVQEILVIEMGNKLIRYTFLNPKQCGNILIELIESE